MRAFGVCDNSTFLAYPPHRFPSVSFLGQPRPEANREADAAVEQ